MTPLLAISGATKTFGPAVRAVDGLSLEVAPGEILGVLGPSGCGKTTLLRLVAGFERLDAGRIDIGGQVADDTRRVVPPERRGVGMVFQDYALFPHLTVAANIAFGLAVRPRGERADRVAWALSLCGLEGLAERYPHELSGGQQQRTALARALAPGCRLLLLDEPLSNLDADTRRTLRDRVRALLREAGVTALLVTHDRDDAFAIADRVAALRQGRVAQCGTARELYTRPASVFVATLVGDASIVPLRVIARLSTTAGAPLAPEAGGDVAAVVRPEDVDMNGDGIGATVRDATFHEGRWLVSLQLETGDVLRAFSVRRPEPGDRVSVGVRAAWPCRGDERAG
jgi:iron(III) transport system ATP-binding protein